MYFVGVVKVFVLRKLLPILHNGPFLLSFETQEILLIVQYRLNFQLTSLMKDKHLVEILQQLNLICYKSSPSE